MVDITDDKEPIVSFNSIGQYFNVCEDISSKAPIELSYAVEEWNPNKILYLHTKVS